MDLRIFDTKEKMGHQAAAHGATLIQRALAENGAASIVVATGASQFEMLSSLANISGIPWNHITAFHLDEYLGLPISHPASFRLYLWQRFVSKLPLPLKAFHYLDGEAEGQSECDRVSQLITAQTIDVAFVGIGENGHLAFNDPPANFETTRPYHIVELDEACRRQQTNEGWFPSLDDVPRQAISMSVFQIMQSRSIVCTVPDERKAEAVMRAVEGPVTPDLPASILQKHDDVVLFVDRPAASQLANAHGG